MLDKVIVIYAIVDDLLKAIGHFDNCRRQMSGVCQTLCVKHENQAGNRSSKAIANRFKAAFQSRIGIVHFLEMFCSARYTTLRADSSVGKVR